MTDQDKEHLEKVGRAIRKSREDCGLNLHELARLCGISAPALSLIETGQRDLRVTSLYRIAAALRVPAGGLLDNRPEENRTNSVNKPGGYDLEDYK